MDQSSSGGFDYHSGFRQAAVPMWVEDWTAVGRVILEHRRTGIDTEAFLAANPALQTDLHRQIQIVDVNESAQALMGVADAGALIGSLCDIIPHSAQSFGRWLSAFARRQPVYRSESRLQRSDGSVRDCFVTAALPSTLEGFSRVIIYVVDISDYLADQAWLAAARKDIARASRVSIMGVLAGSIAHEVNGPLAAIATNAGACLRWLRRPVADLFEAQAAVEGIVRDTARARDVVDRTLSFLSNAPRRSTTLDLIKTIRGSILLIERELRRYGASVRFQSGVDVPLVTADPIQIQQVLVNLLMNAAQAMAGTDGSRDVRILLQPSTSDVCVTVRDAGPGIDPERLPLLLEPFYSTKEDGIGVGLAICRTCVEANGGRIWATSGCGEGASFHFTVPLALPVKKGLLPHASTLRSRRAAPNAAST